MDGWVDAAAWDDLAPGVAVEAIVDEDPVLLVRVGDRAFAVDAFCSHEDRDLASGCVAEDGSWECAHHGGRFDLATGAATRMPAVAPLRTWEVRVDGGRVWVRAA